MCHQVAGTLKMQIILYSTPASHLPDSEVCVTDTVSQALCHRHSDSSPLSHTVAILFSNFSRVSELTYPLLALHRLFIALGIFIRSLRQKSASVASTLIDLPVGVV